MKCLPVLLGYTLLQGRACYLWGFLAGVWLLMDISLVQLHERYARLDVVCSLHCITPGSLTFEINHFYGLESSNMASLMIKDLRFLTSHLLLTRTNETGHL